MFTNEENETLTRTGPGTPMGDLLRRYWIPAFLSEELPEPDCPPVRTRILGEDLVGFRDSRGRVGLLGEYCEHRQASLFYGRNEESGLRCVYHGWKYDIEGNVLDTPAEPPENREVLAAVHHKAYPCIEVNRLIFTYMGPPEKKPLMQNHPWLTLPAEQLCVGCKFFIENNWLQGLDGDLDHIHASYLHSRGKGPAGLGSGRTREGRTRATYLRNVEIDLLPWGVRGASIIPLLDDASGNISDDVLVRTNDFFMPCTGVLGEGTHIIYQVPADDYTCWRYDVMVSLDGPISDDYSVDYREESWPSAGTGWPGWGRKMTRENDYLMQRDRQKSGEIFAGVDARNHSQDAMMTENMGVHEGLGSIVDRTKEHLGVSDRLIIATHQFLLKASRDVQEGVDAPGVAFKPEDNTFVRPHGVELVMPKSGNWLDFVSET